MTTSKLYNRFFDHLAQKRIDIDSDVIKGALVLAGYTPDLDAHDYFNDVTNEVLTTATTLSAAAAVGATTISSVASIPVGTPILIGGTDLRTVTAVAGAGPYTLTVAALSTAQASGASVVANPGYTAGGAALTGVAWTYDASTDTWTLDANDLVWDPATIANARGLVLYDDTPATAATKPLIAWIDFEGPISSTAAPFKCTWHANGILQFKTATA